MNKENVLAGRTTELLALNANPTDRQALTENTVEEGGFAYIGAAHHCDDG